MPFDPRFSYTHEIVRNLQVIERAKAVIDVLPMPPDFALVMKQAARQRATACSTAIEGNTLQSAGVIKAVIGNDRTPGDMEQEVRNYWRALEWIEENSESKRRIDQNYIKTLHRIIIVRGRGRRGFKSDYRTGSCPVINTVTHGIEYGPPRPEDIVSLMDDLEAWLASENLNNLPAPVRAAILAHRFVSIHPFGDGNGRTARALATAELWRSGYDLKGFLSIEEYFASDRDAYYGNLQMGLPMDFYEGRNNPDHTRWITYVSGVMADAADSVRNRAVQFYQAANRQHVPWENLTRRQQQLMTRMLTVGLERGPDNLNFAPSDMEEWFNISSNTAHEWLSEWKNSSFVIPSTKKEGLRVRKWRLSDTWQNLIVSAVDTARSRNDTAQAKS